MKLLAEVASGGVFDSCRESTYPSAMVKEACPVSGQEASEGGVMLLSVESSSTSATWKSSLSVSKEDRLSAEGR